MANRLLEDSNFTYTYDANGNLVQKMHKVNSEVTTYTYDAEDQLIEVTTPTMVVTYRYDALGRRIEKSVNGVITRYIYDNEDVIVELDGGNVVRANYVHGPGIDEPLAVLRDGAGGGLFVYHTDGLGSISHLSSSTGTVVRTYTYDSFGRIVAQTGTATNPYTYTSREFDPETGLYYYRARYYDPTIGRFLQEDPIGIIGGDNFYTYVSNDPVNYYDPLGLAAERRLTNPFPGGVGNPRSPRIFFRTPKVNDNLQVNALVSENTARIIERAVIQAGVASITISSTTEKRTNTKSFHNFGLGVDINRINGRPVDTYLKDLCDPNNPIRRLRQALLDQPGLVELIDPGFVRDSKGMIVTDPQRLRDFYTGKNSHKNHIHFSSKY